MIKGQETFNFIDKRVGVTKDGEQYLALNVLSRDNEKINFITKNSELIDKLGKFDVARFAPIKLKFETNRLYNKEKKFYYWSVELIGVE